MHLRDHKHCLWLHQMPSNRPNTRMNNLKMRLRDHEYRLWLQQML